MNDSIIYKIVNKTNGKYYIGSTSNIPKRFRDHKRELSYNRHHCVALQRAWNKYGFDKFEFIIEKTIKESNQFNVEQQYLDLASLNKENCYNSSYVAGGGIIWKDGINPRTGIPHTQSTKKLMSDRALGKVLSVQQRKQISESNKSRPEKRDALRASLRSTNWNYLNHR